MIASVNIMILFTLLAVPLTCYVILCYTGERGNLAGPIVRGVLWYVPGFVASLAVRALLDLRYQPADLLLFFAVRDAYLPYALGIGGFFVFYHRLASRDDRAMVPAMTLFLAAFLSAFGVGEIILDAGYMGAYRVLVLPAQRAALMALAPVLAGAWVREPRMVLRLLYLLLLLIVPGLTVFAPLLLTFGHKVPGTAVALLVIAASVAAYLLLRASYYPDRGHSDGGVNDAL